METIVIFNFFFTPLKPTTLLIFTFSFLFAVEILFFFPVEVREDVKFYTTCISKEKLLCALI